MFDIVESSTRDAKLRKAEISLPTEPARGEQGVRQYFRRREKHIPAHVRAGLRADMLQ